MTGTAIEAMTTDHVRAHNFGDDHTESGNDVRAISVFSFDLADKNRPLNPTGEKKRTVKDMRRRAGDRRT